MSGLLEIPEQSVFATSTRDYPAYASRDLAVHSSFTTQMERLFETIQTSSASKSIYLGYTSFKEHLSAERNPWIQELANQCRELCNLKQGWNGYNALPPNEIALGLAKALVDEAIREGIEPDHMGASISGGVGFTFANDSYDYVVEFLNDGRIIETRIDQVDEHEPEVRLLPSENPMGQIMGAIKGLGIV